MPDVHTEKNTAFNINQNPKITSTQKQIQTCRKDNLQSKTAFNGRQSLVGDILRLDTKSNGR